MVKRGLAVGIFLTCMLLLSLPAAAESSMPDFEAPLEQFYAAIPDHLRESLPEGILGETRPNADALADAVSLGGLLDRVRAFLTDALPAAGRLLGRIAVCLLFAALFAALCAAFSGGRIGDAAQLIGRLSVALVLLEAHLGQMELVTACLRQMQQLLAAMLPLLGAILAAGGNPTAAVAGSGSLLLGLSFGEILCTSLFLPLIAAAAGLAGVVWLPGGERLGKIAACLRKITVWGLGLFGTVLSAVLAFQTVLASGADSIAVRTVKFAVGSAVPVIGGAVGDTVRIAASAMGYLKDTTGLLGIFVLALLALPPLLQLFLHRAVLLVGEALAELLGCTHEGKLLGEFASVSGMLLALLCVALLCFLFALTLFIRINLAIAV